MASTPMWARARRFLEQNPDATARHLQEALGCTKLSAVKMLARWKQEQATRGTGQLIHLPKPTGPKGRIRYEDLPETSRQRVTQQLNRLLEYIQLTNDRLIEQHAKLSPIQHSQLANALSNAMTALQKLTDTYPGLSAIAASDDGDKSKEAALEADLQNVDDWLGSA